MSLCWTWPLCFSVNNKSITAEAEQACGVNSILPLHKAEHWDWEETSEGFLAALLLRGRSKNELFIRALALHPSKRVLKEAVWRPAFSVCSPRFPRHIQNKSPTVLLSAMTAQLQDDQVASFFFHSAAKQKNPSLLASLWLIAWLSTNLQQGSLH